ncbi:MAG: YqaA family protein [Acidobacteriota bacterium]
MTPQESRHFFGLFTWPRRLYDWMLSLAERPNGVRALFLIAFAESSFFPIPPDVLLIPLAVGAPRRALWFSTICTVGSLLGAILGYLLGLQFYEMIGQRIVEFYSAQGQYQQVKTLYQEWEAIAIAVAGFTPIPFKVFTITAGVFRVNLLTFVLATMFSRGARFFLLGGLISWFGPSIQSFVDRYFNLLTVLFVILLVGGFLILRYAI